MININIKKYNLLGQQYNACFVGKKITEYNQFNTMKICNILNEENRNQRKCITTFQATYSKNKRKDKKYAQCKIAQTFNEPVCSASYKIYRNPHLLKQKSQIIRIESKIISTGSQTYDNQLQTDQCFLNLCRNGQCDVKTNIQKVYSRFRTIQDYKYQEQVVTKTYYQFGKNIIRFNQTNKTRELSDPFINLFTQQLQQIVIRGDFQSGNLASFRKISHNLYVIQLKNDTNTKGFTQWFQFYLQSTRKNIDFEQIKGNALVNFIIVNIKKPIRFVKGMKLLTRSYKQSKQVYEEWSRNLQFQFFQSNIMSSNQRNYYSIAFSLQYKKLINGIFVALSYPYPLSRLNYLWEQVKNISNQFKIIQIGRSTLGNQILLYKLSNNLKKVSKKNLVIIARQHASQTSSSFICQFMIKRITIFNCYQKLLKEYNIHIIPILNPDGVVHGNSRTNFRGYDINRCWAPYLLVNSPQAQSIYNYMQKINIDCQDILLDLHSHSRQLGLFSYINFENEFTNAFNQKMNSICKYYNSQKCRTGFDTQKRNTFRVQMFNRFKVKNVLTIQASYYGYKCKQSKQLKYYTISDYQQISDNILQSIQSYLSREGYKNTIKQQNMVSTKKQIHFQAKSIFQSNICSQSQSDSDPQGDYLNQQDRKNIEQLAFICHYKRNKIKISQKLKKNQRTHSPFQKMVSDKKNLAQKQKIVTEVNLYQATTANQNAQQNSSENKSYRAFSLNTRITNVCASQKQQIFVKRCRIRNFQKSVNCDKTSSSKQLINQNYIQRQSFKNLYISAQLRNQKLISNEKFKIEDKCNQSTYLSKINSNGLLTFESKNTKSNNIKNIIFPQGMPNKDQYQKQIKTIENIIRKKNVPSYSKYFINQKKLQTKDKLDGNQKISYLYGQFSKKFNNLITYS